MQELSSTDLHVLFCLLSTPTTVVLSIPLDTSTFTLFISASFRDLATSLFALAIRFSISVRSSLNIQSDGYLDN